VAKIRVSDVLWDDFHQVVNMTSRELDEWLRVDASGEVAEELPDKAGPELGRRVLGILGKRRADLTDDDVSVMTRVVERVMTQRRADLEPTAGDSAWRHRLMSVGHDPLKPVV